MRAKNLEIRNSVEKKKEKRERGEKEILLLYFWIIIEDN